ncbi:hypothetical protein Tco_0562454 [Tanacetum coccineum]
MDSNFTNENDPWEYSLDIDDSDLHLTPVLRSSSSAHVEPSPYTPNPVTIIPGPAGVVQLSNSICVEPSSSTPNPVRIIPGPAGLVQRAKLLKENVFILDPDGALMSTQEYMQKVVEDVGEDADFNSGAWVSATNYVNAFGGTVTGCLGDIDNFLKKGKLEQVVAIVKSCSPNALGDLNVTLKDLSGTVPGTIHYKVLDVSSYEKDITVGAAMILANVSVFTPKPSKHYLNITKRNVVEVFRKDTVVNFLMLSATGPTPVASQTGGVMQGCRDSATIACVQAANRGSPVPLSSKYYALWSIFFPILVHPPPIHQFLNNGTFPQQPQGGSMYPVPPLASPKYPLPQYTPGGNAGNPGHIGMPGGYGPYGSTSAGYNPGSATIAGNSTSNEDFGGPQFKESNAYMTGQQSEGGQVAYSTQAGHGTFAGIYHPAQPVTTGAIHPHLQQSGTSVDMVPGTRSTSPVPKIRACCCVLGSPTEFTWREGLERASKIRYQSRGQLSCS